LSSAEASSGIEEGEPEPKKVKFDEN